MDEHANLEKAVFKICQTATELMMASLLDAQENMTDESRVAFWQFLQRGYCPECGRKTDTICHCRNDE